MKKIIYALATAFILSISPSPAMAQNDLLKTGVKILGGLFGGSNKESNSQPREETQDVQSSNAYASTETQQSERGAIKIVSGHPDLKVKVRRCEASGKTCIIDLTMTNMGVNDVYADISGTYYDYKSSAIDDQGNIYDMSIRLANEKQYHNNNEKIPLVSEVPMKVSIRLDNVPESSEIIAKMELAVQCDELGLQATQANGWKRHYVVIRNIPISRD